MLDPLLDLRTPITEIFECNIFVSAARLGEADVVRSLIARGIDVIASAGTALRRTALEAAVIIQHPRVVELLLNEGVNPKTLNSRSSLLCHALDGPHRVETLEILFNKGADVNAIGYNTDWQMPLLPNAVEAGKHETTRLLLKSGADIDAFDHGFGTALQLAVAREVVEAVQLLIDAGADINAQAGRFYHVNKICPHPKLLRSPIQEASLAGNAEIVQILVDESADVNAFQLEGYDPVPCHWEEYRRHQWQSYDEFEESPSYQHIMMTPLQAAGFREDPVIGQILMDAGAHVDEEAYGDTPLHMVVALDETRIMQVLGDIVLTSTLLLLTMVEGPS